MGSRQLAQDPKQDLAQQAKEADALAGSACGAHNHQVHNQGAGISGRSGAHVAWSHNVAPEDDVNPSTNSVVVSLPSFHWIANFQTNKTFIYDYCDFVNSTSFCYIHKPSKKKMVKSVSVHTLQLKTMHLLSVGSISISNIMITIILITIRAVIMK